MYLSGCIYICGFGFEEKYWRIYGFGGKKALIGRICIPLFTRLLCANTGIQVALEETRANHTNAIKKKHDKVQNGADSAQELPEPKLGKLI